MIRRGKLFTVVFVALVGGLFALEMFVLQGTCVFDERIELREGAKVEIRLDRVGEPHLIEFYTRRERRLKGTMTAPDGSEVWSLDEWADHKSHYVSFTPEVAGTYVLEAQRGFLERIDFVLLAPGLLARTRAVELPRGGALEQVSDHYPVVVTLGPGSEPR